MTLCNNGAGSGQKVLYVIDGVGEITSGLPEMLQYGLHLDPQLGEFAIPNCPPHCRVVILLCAVQGHPQQEIDLRFL
jgi:hypothetical protein